MEYLVFRVVDNTKQYLTLENIANEWTDVKCNASTFGDHNVLHVCHMFEGAKIEIK